MRWHTALVFALLLFFGMAGGQAQAQELRQTKEQPVSVQPASDVDKAAAAKKQMLLNAEREQAEKEAAVDEASSKEKEQTMRRNRQDAEAAEKASQPTQAEVGPPADAASPE